MNTGTGDTETKDILINNNRISKISEEIRFEAEGLKVIELSEKYTLPGLIDCHTHLGIIEEATGKIGIDNNEISEPVTPQLRGIDAINPMDIAFEDALRTGVTTVMSGPGSNNAVGGLSAAIKTHGCIIDKMVLKNTVGLKIALGENPISTYGKNDKCPVTRMATASLIRELFMKTQDYMTLKDQGAIKVRDMKLEAVVPVLKGEISLRAHAHRADDIVTAIRIADEFNIKKLVIEHGTEAHLIKDYLREKNIPVAFGPMLTPRIKVEMKGRKYTSILELSEAGVKVALITDHPYNSIDQLRMIAILAHSEGLSVVDTLKSITIHPAEILECQNRVGSLKEGYDADIAVFDGHPFDIDSKVFMTIVNGEIVYKAESK
jgi:Imidazolonepropionase and related amidohydrolases